MRKICLFFILFGFLLLLSADFQLWATHNRAGEIVYTHLNDPDQPFKYEVSVITYTRIDDPHSLDADRPFLTVSWGHGGLSDTLHRINGPLVEGKPQGDVISSATKKNIYTGTHVFPGEGVYVISMEDPNRVENILNIGSSVDIPFYIEDTLFVKNVFAVGHNNSPQLLFPPIDFAPLGQVFEHNPQAFDPDGDLLTFELIPPKRTKGIDVPDYRLPNEVVGTDDPTLTCPKNVSIDRFTGTFVWDCPHRLGIYNIAILIREFRNGELVGTMVRDMQIDVIDIDNEPPIISQVRDTCVVAGNTLNIIVSAADEDLPEQVLTMDATGQPLEFEEDPALFFRIRLLEVWRGLFCGCRIVSIFPVLNTAWFLEWKIITSTLEDIISLCPIFKPGPFNWFHHRLKMFRF